MKFTITDLALIERADAFAAEAHGRPRPGHPHGQLREYTGEPYIVHPREVAAIIKNAGLPAEAIAAALLHDVLEDCEGVTVHDLRVHFGVEVTALVIEVTDVSQKGGIDGNRASRKAKDRRHLALASPNGQSIKCADLISNTASIVARDLNFARRYLPEKRQTLAILTRADPLLLEMAHQSLAQGEVTIYGALAKIGTGSGN